MVRKFTSKKWFIVKLVLTVITAVVCVFLIRKMNIFNSTEPVSSDDSRWESMPVVEVVSEPVDIQTLVGQWVRTDSPYVIEIRQVSEDGNLEAGYYNPRSINVSIAKAEDKNGTLEVFVELRDTGYPGSNYTLKYNPGNDALEGIYLQAALQQKFNVVFKRLVQQD
ncbi:MAG: hypothetical protein ACYTFM_01450 [Planctomycetota bacterium]|jgi:hypothetical protein